MKHLATIIVLLFLTAPAHAQSPQDVLLMQCAGQYVYCHTDGSGEVYGRNKPTEQWRVMGKLIPGEYDDCMNHMEAAMRDMDRYIFPWPLGTEPPGGYETYFRAVRYWETVKQQCWSKP